MTIIQKLYLINENKYLDAYRNKPEKIRAKFRFCWKALEGFPPEETNDFIVRDYLIEEEIKLINDLHKEMFGDLKND